MNTQNLDAILLFPPGWSATSPYLSVPLLTAYLCQGGIKTKGVDLNIRIIDSILKDQCLRNSVVEIDHMLKQTVSQEHRKELLLALDIFRLIENRVDESIFHLRNDLVTPAGIVEINRVIDAAYRVYSAPFFPGRIFEGALVYTNQSVCSNVLTYDDYSVAHTITELICCVENKDQNPYWPFIEEYVSDLDVEGLKFVGLSVCGYSQLITALCIASLLRKKGVIIVMGGAIMPYISEAIEYNSSIFKYVDYIISGEGEHSLLELGRALINQKDVQNVEGVTYYDNKTNCVKRNEKKKYVDMRSLPTPIFNKDELGMYLIPKDDLALPLIGSKGCYWGKCAFCGINCNYDGKIRRKCVDIIISDMKNMISLYKIDKFRLIDNCIQPSFMKGIAEALLKEQLHISWQCMARFDKNFDLEIWEKAYRSGLKLVSFGLESPSQYMLDKMNKGIDASCIPAILSDCVHVGIFTHCFFIVGFPGEEHLDPVDLIDYIRINRYIINSLTISNYRLESQSMVYDNMKKFHLELAKEYPSDYILPNYEHKDFCNSLQRINYVRSEIADLECSEICFSGFEDMYVIGEIFNDRRNVLLNWQKNKIKIYKRLIGLINDRTDSEMYFDNALFFSENEYCVLFYNKTFFNYFIFINQTDNRFSLKLNQHIQFYIKHTNNIHLEYIYDILAGYYLMNEQTNLE